jgi:PAS domain S-box-containing protein
MPHRVRRLAWLMALTGLYFLAGRLGLSWAVINPSASPVWPPTGIALASALLFGLRVWPAIFIGAVLVNYSTVPALGSSLGIAVGNTAEALVGAYLVTRFANGRFAFDRSRDFFVFVGLAGFVSTVVSATVGTTSLAVSGALEWSAYFPVWLTWWLGNAAGNIVVAPLLVLWKAKPNPGWTRPRFLEVLVSAAVLVSVAILVFAETRYPLEFLTIPLCVWVGVRFGPREASTATALVASVACWAAAQGTGPFGYESPNTALLLTQMFIVVAQIAGLGMGTSIAEMNLAHRKLGEIKDKLEEQVTERTAELRASEARLAEAQEVAQIGSWEWDPQAGRLLWSEELYRIYGVAPGSFQPSYDTFLAMMHEDDRPNVIGTVDRALADGQPFEFEFRLLRADGVTRVGLSRGRSIRSDDGNSVRLVGIAQDITDRKLLDARVRQAQKLEALGLLAAGIAHDFNNLLTAICGYTDLMLAAAQNEDPLRDDLVEVKKAGERAAALTRRLLAFSRTQSLQPRNIDVNGVVTGLEHLLRRTIGEDIELALILDRQLRAVRVDPDQLEQVILNISFNARDAMPTGGTLSFITSMVEVDAAWAQAHPPMLPGSYVRLSVADTGVGMSPDVQARIFEPFFTTKPPGQGTGFGLATVYGIVKQSGGFIWVSSTPGAGSVFEIYLPSLDLRADEAGDIHRDTPPTGSGERILIVEDDSAVRGLARDVLLQAGYAVVDARDGGEALALTTKSSRSVDLLVTDLIMPGLTGRELALQLKIQFPYVRVLYTSGYTRAAALTAGIDPRAPFLAKPFLPATLLSKVREALTEASGLTA